jgi:ATP-dependent DNA helicase RecG
MAEQGQLELLEHIRMSIRLGESHFREFKTAFEQSPQKEGPRDVKPILKDIAEALVAFANADGGELIVGVEDDGKITGVPHKEELIDIMIRAPFTHIHKDTPLPSPKILKMIIGKGPAMGRGLLYFAVSKGTRFIHLTSDGKCLQRHDRETLPVAVEQIQYDRRERISREYDRAFIEGATTAHLDTQLLSKIVQEINPTATPEKVLQFLDLAEYEPIGLRLRRATLLLFANEISKWHPRSQIRVIKVSGNSLGVGREYNVSKDDTIQGNILDLLTNAWDMLRPHLAITRLGTGARFHEALIYPEDACMEALVNAVAHRDYSIEGRGIEIYIFDDRMEIISPGGILSSISIEELRRLRKVHQSRNPYITRVLRELGYMRELGEGIPRIFKAMEERDIVLPDLQSSKDKFTISLYHRSVFTPKDRQWLDSLDYLQLTRDEQRVLLIGRDGHLITPSEIRKTLNIIDTADYAKIIASLKAKGALISVRPDSELRRKYTAAQRKEIGRFGIRPIGELQHYYDELIQALQQVGPSEHPNPRVLCEKLRRISGDNPHCNSVTGCAQALRHLGLVDSEGKPLEKLTSLWGKKRR